MGGEDSGLVRQPTETLQTAVLEAGKLAGVLETEEVGTPGRSDKQAPSGEDGLLFAVDEDEIAGVLGCVAGSVQGANDEAAFGVKLLVVERGDEWESSPSRAFGRSVSLAPALITGSSLLVS